MEFELNFSSTLLKAARDEAVKRDTCISPIPGWTLKPRLHDTTGCQPAVSYKQTSTGCLTTVLNEQLFFQPVVKPV